MTLWGALLLGAPEPQQWLPCCPGGLRPERDIPGLQVSQGDEQILSDGLGVGGTLLPQEKGVSPPWAEDCWPFICFLLSG